MTLSASNSLIDVTPARVASFFEFEASVYVFLTNLKKHMNLIQFLGIDYK